MNAIYSYSPHKFPFRLLWIILLFLSYMLSTYYLFGGWWNSSVGTGFIVFFGFMVWRKGFLNVIGLGMGWKTALNSLLAAAVATLLSYLTMKYIGLKHNTIIQFTNWRNYYHDIFYTLNEEIVLGAISLFLMVKKFRMKPFFACLGLAMAFSLIHFVFYKWVFLEKGTILPTTLTTLFLVGFVRNSLIVFAGHIGYSWALHFSWMAVMFGCWHYHAIRQTGLSEYERFNMYLGSSDILAVSGVLSVVVLVGWVKKCGGFAKLY